MKRLLTCLDNSPRQHAVLAAAVDLAKRTGAKLVLLRVVGLPDEIGQEIIGVSPNEILERMQAKAKSDLDAVASKIDRALLEGTHVRVGSPWDAICREAKHLECDLIVIGSHGYGGIDRVLGTTAAKVVNNTDRSVFVARTVERSDAHG